MSIITTIEILEASIQCMMLNKKHITSKVFDQFKYIHLFEHSLEKIFNLSFVAHRTGHYGKDTDHLEFSKDRVLAIRTDINIIGIVEDTSYVYIDIGLTLYNNIMTHLGYSKQHFHGHRFIKCKSDRWIVIEYNKELFKVPVDWNLDKSSGIDRLCIPHYNIETALLKIFNNTKQVFIGRPF